LLMPMHYKQHCLKTFNKIYPHLGMGDSSLSALISQCIAGRFFNGGDGK
jgi:hypothetical protein